MSSFLPGNFACFMTMLNVAGTLTRCLESLERVEQEHPDSNSTTEALKQVRSVMVTLHLT